MLIHALLDHVLDHPIENEIRASLSRPPPGVRQAVPSASGGMGSLRGGVARLQHLLHDLARLVLWQFIENKDFARNLVGGQAPF